MSAKDMPHDEFLDEAVERFDFFTPDVVRDPYDPVKNKECHKVFYESQVVTFVRTPICYDPKTDEQCKYFRGTVSRDVGACSYAYDNHKWLLDMANAIELKPWEELIPAQQGLDTEYE